MSVMPNVLNRNDADLPTLASQAAVELDNIYLGEIAEVAPIENLASLLLRASERGTAGTRLSLLVDPTTVMAMNMAIDDADLSPQLKTVEEVIGEAEKIGAKLRQVVNAATNSRHYESLISQDEVAKLRSFCIALAERAAASERSVDEWEPRHPWRR